MAPLGRGECLQSLLVQHCWLAHAMKYSFKATTFGVVFYYCTCQYNRALVSSFVCLISKVRTCYLLIGCSPWCVSASCVLGSNGCAVCRLLVPFAYMSMVCFGCLDSL